MRWCENHVGTKEVGYTNHTIFWEWYRRIYGYTLQGASWCGAAVCVEMNYGAGWTPPSDFTGVWAIEQWGRANGRYHSGVTGLRAGDILILLNHGQHTGIARAVPKAGFVRTYEGNTEPGNYGSQANGGGYYKRLRPYYQVIGYVRVHDIIEAHKSPSPTPDFGFRPLPMNVDGNFGPQTVGHLQKSVEDLIDGVFTRQTKRHLKRHLNQKLGLTGVRRLNTRHGWFGHRAIKRLQQHLGVRQTGIWTKGTTIALQKKLNARKF